MPPKISQWFLTYPQCEGSQQRLLDHLVGIDKVVHYIIACEKHKDGNSHLHAYIKFVDGVTKLKAVKVFDFDDYHGNYQAVRSPKAVIKYCSKEDNYISNFDIAAYQNKKGKLPVSVLKSQSTKQVLESGEISFMQARAYAYARAVVEEPYEHTDVRGIWITGPPGTGKSHIAREHAKSLGGYFSTQQNKWFDGYNQEKVILFDDFDKTGVNLSQKMKLWSDKYACQGEIKGGTMQLAHHELIVTSNYTIDEIWPDDEALQIALKRRFRVVLIADRHHQPDPLTLLIPEDKALKCPKRTLREGTIGDNRMSFTEREVFDGTTLRKNPRII